MIDIYQISKILIFFKLWYFFLHYNIFRYIKIGIKLIHNIKKNNKKTEKFDKEIYFIKNGEEIVIYNATLNIALFAFIYLLLNNDADQYNNIINLPFVGLIYLCGEYKQYKPLLDIYTQQQHGQFSILLLLIVLNVNLYDEIRQVMFLIPLFFIISGIPPLFDAIILHP